MGGRNGRWVKKIKNKFKNRMVRIKEGELRLLVFKIIFWLNIWCEGWVYVLLWFLSLVSLFFLCELKEVYSIFCSGWGLRVLFYMFFWFMYNFFRIRVFLSFFKGFRNNDFLWKIVSFFIIGLISCLWK